MANSRKKSVEFRKMTPPAAKKVSTQAKKKDDVPFSAEMAEIWFSVNWPKLVVAVLIIAVAAVGYIIFDNVREQNRIAAREAFGAASTAEELRAAMAKYPETMAAQSGRLAALLIEDGKLDDAVAVLDGMANDAEVQPFIRTKALIDKAYVLELSGKNKEAVQTFESLASNVQTDEVLRAEAAYSQARLLFASGDTEEASKALAVVNTARTDRNDPYCVWAEKASALKFKIDEAMKKVSPAPAPAPVQEAAK